jgi:DNA-binding MarR family transcriptional regulator
MNHAADCPLSDIDALPRQLISLRKGPASMTTEGKRVEYPLGGALDFLEHIWHLNHALERLSSRMEHKLGITAQQRLVVRCVGKFPGMTAGHLAAVLHLDPGTISATLKRLERKKLLTRRRDARDKRRVTLGLTQAGRVLAVPAKRTVEYGVERLIKSVDPAALATTKDVLRSLTALLDAEVHASQASSKSNRA